MMAALSLAVFSKEMDYLKEKREARAKAAKEEAKKNKKREAVMTPAQKEVPHTYM